MKNLVIGKSIFFYKEEDRIINYCPFCNNMNLIEKESDKIFLERVGCLDCDKWLQPVRLRPSKE